MAKITGRDYTALLIILRGRPANSSIGFIRFALR
jgi:hypothetical protein